ncbi:MAG: hypothetical protein PHN49_07945, partial [Candidatus Omnitrophica bacterium]|nr:hypothetical protein [Candidatus Omnitrophota bacterium]
FGFKRRQAIALKAASNNAEEELRQIAAERQTLTRTLRSFEATRLISWGAMLGVAAYLVSGAFGHAAFTVTSVKLAVYFILEVIQNYILILSSSEGGLLGSYFLLIYFPTWFAAKAWRLASVWLDYDEIPAFVRFELPPLKKFTRGVIGKEIDRTRRKLRGLEQREARIKKQMAEGRRSSMIFRSEMRTKKTATIQQIDMDSLSDGQNRNILRSIIAVNKHSGWDFSRLNADLEGEIEAGNAGGTVFKAVNARNRPVGFLWLNPVSSTEGAELYLITMRKSWHGTGVADQLADAALVYLNQAYVTKIGLAIETNNRPSYRFFDKLIVRHGLRIRGMNIETTEGKIRSEGQATLEEFVRFAERQWAEVGHTEPLNGHINLELTLALARSEIRGKQEIEIQQADLGTLSRAQRNERIHEIIDVNRDSGWDFSQLNDDLETEMKYDTHQGTLFRAAARLKGGPENAVGFAWVQTYPEKREAEFYLISVRKAWHGTGVSEQLADAVMDYFRRLRIRKFRIAIDTRNQLSLRFFDHLIVQHGLQIDFLEIHTERQFVIPVSMTSTSLQDFVSDTRQRFADKGRTDDFEGVLHADLAFARSETRESPIEARVAEAMQKINERAAGATSGDIHAIDEQFQDKTLSPPPVIQDGSAVWAVGNQIFVGRDVELDADRLADYFMRLKKIMILLQSQIHIVGDLLPTPQKGPTIAALAELCRLPIAVAEGREIRANKERITLGIDVIVLDQPQNDRNLVMALFRGRMVLAEQQRKTVERKQTILASLEAVDQTGNQRRQKRIKPALSLDGQSLFLVRLGDIANALAAMPENPERQHLFSMISMLEEIAADAAGFEAASPVDFSSYLARRYAAALRQDRLRPSVAEELIKLHTAPSSGETIQKMGYAAFQATRLAQNLLTLRNPLLRVSEFISELRDYAVSVSLEGDPSLIRPSVDWLAEIVLQATSAHGGAQAPPEWGRIETFLAGAYGIPHAFPAGVLMQVEETYAVADAVLKERQNKQILARAFALSLLLRAGEPAGEGQSSSLLHASNVVTSMIELFKAAKKIPSEETQARLLGAAWLDGITQSGTAGAWGRIQMRSEVRISPEATAARVAELVRHQVGQEVIALVSHRPDAGTTSAAVFDMAQKRTSAREILEVKLSAALELMLKNIERLNLRARAAANTAEQPESPEADTLFDAYNLLNSTLPDFPPVRVDIPSPAARVGKVTEQVPFAMLPKAEPAAPERKIFMLVDPATSVDVFACHLLRIALHVQNQHKPEGERQDPPALNQAVERVLNATHHMKLAGEELTPDERDAESFDVLMDGVSMTAFTQNQKLFSLGIELVTDPGSGRMTEIIFNFPQPAQRAQMLMLLRDPVFERELRAVLADEMPDQTAIDESVREQLFRRQGHPAPSLGEVSEVRARLASGQTVADKPEAVRLIEESRRRQQALEELKPAVIESMKAARDFFVAKLEQAVPNERGEIQARVPRTTVRDGIAAGRLAGVTGFESNIRGILGSDVYSRPELNDPVEILLRLFEREAKRSDVLSLGPIFKRLVNNLRSYFDRPLSRWQFFARELNRELENERVTKKNDLTQLTEFMSRMVMAYTIAIAIRKGVALERLGADPSTVREALDALADDLEIYFNAGGQLGRRGDDAFRPVLVAAIRAIDLSRFPPYLRQSVITQHLPNRIEHLSISRQAAQRVQTQMKSQPVDAGLSAALAQTADQGKRLVLGGKRGEPAKLLGDSTPRQKKPVALLEGPGQAGAEGPDAPAQVEQQAIDVKKFSPHLPGSTQGGNYWTVEKDLITEAVKALTGAAAAPGPVAATEAQQQTGSQPSVLDRFAERYPAAWGQNMDQAVLGMHTPTFRDDDLSLDELSEWLIFMLTLYYSRGGKSGFGFARYGLVQQAFATFRKDTQIITDQELAALLTQINAGREGEDQLKEEDALAILFLFCMLYGRIRYLELQQNREQADALRRALAEKLPELGVSVPIFAVVQLYLQNYEAGGSAGAESVALDQEAREEKRAGEAVEEFRQNLRQAQTVSGPLATEGPEGFLTRIRACRAALSLIFHYGTSEMPRDMLRMLFLGIPEPDPQDTKSVDDAYRSVAQMVRTVVTTQTREEAPPETPFYEEVFKFATEARNYLISSDLARHPEMRTALTGMLPRLFEALDRLDTLRETQRREEDIRPQRELAEKLTQVHETLTAGPAGGGAAMTEEQLARFFAESPLLRAVESRLGRMEAALTEIARLLRGQGPRENLPPPGDQPAELPPPPAQPVEGSVPAPRSDTGNTIAGGTLETVAGQSSLHGGAQFFLTGSEQPGLAIVTTAGVGDLVRLDMALGALYLPIVMHDREPGLGQEIFRISGTTIRYQRGDEPMRELRPVEDAELLAIPEVDRFMNLFMTGQTTRVRHIRLDHPDLEAALHEIVVFPDGQMYAAVTQPGGPAEGLHIFPEGLPPDLAMIARQLPWTASATPVPTPTRSETRIDRAEIERQAREYVEQTQASSGISKLRFGDFLADENRLNNFLNHGWARQFQFRFVFENDQISNYRLFRFVQGDRERLIRLMTESAVLGLEVDQTVANLRQRLRERFGIDRRVARITFCFNPPGEQIASPIHAIESRTLIRGMSTFRTAAHQDAESRERILLGDAQISSFEFLPGFQGTPMVENLVNPDGLSNTLSVNLAIPVMEPQCLGHQMESLEAVVAHELGHALFDSLAAVMPMGAMSYGYLVHALQRGDLSNAYFDQLGFDFRPFGFDSHNEGSVAWITGGLREAHGWWVSDQLTSSPGAVRNPVLESALDELAGIYLAIRDYLTGTGEFSGNDDIFGARTRRRGNAEDRELLVRRAAVIESLTRALGLERTPRMQELHEFAGSYAGYGDLYKRLTGETPLPERYTDRSARALPADLTGFVRSLRWNRSESRRPAIEAGRPLGTRPIARAESRQGSRVAVTASARDELAKVRVKKERAPAAIEVRNGTANSWNDMMHIVNAHLS